MILRAFVTMYSVILIGIFFIFGYLVAFVWTASWKNAKLSPDDEKIVIFSKASGAGRQGMCPLTYTTDGAVLIEYPQPIHPKFAAENEKINLYKFLRHDLPKAKTFAHSDQTAPAKSIEDEINDVVLKIMDDKGEPRIEINLGSVESKSRTRRSRARKNKSRSNIKMLIKRNDTVIKSELNKAAEFQLLPNNTLLIFNNEAGAFAAININAGSNGVSDTAGMKERENFSSAVNVAVNENSNVTNKSTENNEETFKKNATLITGTKDMPFSTVYPLTEPLNVYNHTLREDVDNDELIEINQTTETDETPLIINLLEWHNHHV